MTEKITEKIDGHDSSLSSYSDNDSFLPLKSKIFQHFGRKNVHKVLGQGKCTQTITLSLSLLTDF